MDVKRYALVPIDSQGIEDIDNWNEEESEHVEWYEITGEEINRLFKKKVIQQINAECELMIDAYESEKVDSSKAGKCLEIFAAHDEIKCNMARAIKAALNYGTCAHIDL